MKWTQQEIDYLKQSVATKSISEIASDLGRPVSSVNGKIYRMNGAIKAKNRRWTKEEEEWLAESWGRVTFDGICKHLNRTKSAILVRVQRLGLPPYLEAGGYITMHQLILALGCGASDSYKQKSWVENRGFPVHNKRRGKAVVRVVYLDEFWEWAEKNRSFINFGRMEPLALGKEPAWVAEQRRKDFQSFAIQRKDVWTAYEDSRLTALVKQQKYGYAELSEMLHRSAGAIQRRCIDLGLKDRPVRADNRGESCKWLPEHITILADGIRNGDSYMLIGQKIGKSEKAVRGKVYIDYLTENADSVRQMMGDGEWGDGAPVPTVKQALTLSRTKSETRKDLSLLVAALKKRANDLGFDPYWQKEMCVHWDDIGGCAAGCDNCDECSEFVRIKPQYCARCGATFYERKENRFCKSCRTARKKHSQRHWCRINTMK